MFHILNVNIQRPSIYLLSCILVSYIFRYLHSPVFSFTLLLARLLYDESQLRIKIEQIIQFDRKLTILGDERFYYRLFI